MCLCVLPFPIFFYFHATPVLKLSSLGFNSKICACIVKCSLLGIKDAGQSLHIMPFWYWSVCIKIIHHMIIAIVWSTHQHKHLILWQKFHFTKTLLKLPAKCARLILKWLSLSYNSSTIISFIIHCLKKHTDENQFFQVIKSNRAVNSQSQSKLICNFKFWLMLLLTVFHFLFYHGIVSVKLRLLN